MKLRNRLGLVGLGIIIFLIVTPVLVLYARGFKVDFEKRTFVKTGALVIKTEPNKAEIYLNDELQKSQTPANLRFLLPNDYNIRIEKENYQSWTKRLTVKSQLVTWANIDRDYITMFLSNPDLTKTIDSSATTVSRNGEEIIYLTPDGVKLVSVNNGDDRNLVQIANLTLPLINSDTQIEWQNSSGILNLFASKSVRDYLQSHASTISHLAIDNGNVLIQMNSELVAVTSTRQTLIDKNVTNFTLRGNEIWYLQRNVLKHYNFSNNNIDSIYATLPAYKTGQVIRTNNQIYLILDQSLYRYNGSLEKINSTATTVYWHENSSQMVYANDHEIYLYNPNQNNSELIVRSLTPISKPVLNLETGYIFYQNEGKIKAIELDGRDHRNIFTIADAMDDFAISGDGKRLFVLNQNKIHEYVIR